MAATAIAPITAPRDERHKPPAIEACLCSGIGEPSPNGHGKVWDRSDEDARVRAESPPVDRARSQDEHPRDYLGPPAEPLADDLRRQADLFVHLPERGLRRQELCLHLDHDEVAGFSSPAENIERSALAVLREVTSVRTVHPSRSRRSATVPPSRA